VSKLYEELLFDELYLDDGPHIDLNAVSIIDGKPQTVMDYIEEQLADPANTAGYKREVASLKEMFRDELGAKKFSELPKAEQQKYIKHFSK